MEVLKAAVQPLADEDKQKTRLGKKSLKSEKRIVSGFERNIGTMRFIVGRFTSFSLEVDFLPNIVWSYYLSCST